MKQIFSFLLLFSLCFNIHSQLFIDTSKNTKNIVKFFLASKSGIEIKNVHYEGNRYSIGLFKSFCEDFPLKKGVILSTGDIWDAVGPNSRNNSGSYHYFKGNSQLEALANGKTFDAALLEFDFMANSDSISFDYIFASEEYPEFVNKGLNDIFAFFVSDSFSNEYNIALCNSLPVTVNNINTNSNSAFYISNDLTPKTNLCLFRLLQFDGFTVKLSAGLKIVPYRKYHFKICIADVGDGYFDSAVMLRANSFISIGKTNFSELAENLKTTLNNDLLHLSADSTRIIFIPNITFDFDSSVISNKYKPSLEHIVNNLRSLYDFKIEITGYSDIIGSKEYNTKLSLMRAQSVANYFILNKIEKNRITCIGLGTENPIESNADSTGRSKNRRVTIKLYR